MTQADDIDLSGDLEAMEELALEIASAERLRDLGIAREMLKSGGKRFRPKLLLLAARMAGAQSGDGVMAAAAVELVHNASLIHDDIVDNCAERRGAPAVHVTAGVTNAVLLGDLLYMGAIAALAETGPCDAAAVLGAAMRSMIKGELSQRACIGDIDLCWEEYSRIIHLKTASLIAASAEIGGIVARCGPGQRRALNGYGAALGAAFQILDDIGDYVRSREAHRRDPRNDLRQRLVTAPLILALGQCTDEERGWIKHVFASPAVEDGLAAELTDFIRAKGGFAKAKVQAHALLDTAVENLACFRDGAAKEMLTSFARALAEPV
jgi:octaprenyl-diphosphate synthase